jgi:hypothetical protein
MPRIVNEASRGPNNDSTPDPKTPEHLELELAPENYRLKLSSLPKVCPDKNFKFRVTGHRHPLEPAT